MQLLTLFFATLTLMSHAAVQIVPPDGWPPQATVVDARSSKRFEAGHVPGARHLDWKDFSEGKPGFWSWVTRDTARWGLLRMDADVQSSLRSLGLSHRTPIAVIGSPEEEGAEGRVAWSLLTWGAQEVLLVDGGYEAWSQLGKTPETGPMKPAPPGDFTLSPRSERRALKAQVLELLQQKGRALLDVRNEKEFVGETRTGQKRGGHLPGARLTPFKALYQGDGRFVQAEALRALVGELNNPVAYCTAGVRSALLAVLVEARLGTVVANYDGSLLEWGADAELPLVQ